MKSPIYPTHPERTCWGCPKYCPADDLACGNGTIRTLHPMELFGDDWPNCLDEGATNALERNRKLRLSDVPELTGRLAPQGRVG